MARQRLWIMPPNYFGNKHIISSSIGGYLINYNFSQEDLIPFIKDIINNPSQFYNSFYAHVMFDLAIINNSLIKSSHYSYFIPFVYLHKINDSCTYVEGNILFWSDIETIHLYDDLYNQDARAYYNNLFKKLLLIQ